MGTFRFWMTLLMSLVMGVVPAFASANGVLGGEGAGRMISTSAVLAGLNRTEIEQGVLNAVKQDEVKKELLRNGVSADEVSRRVASLSDSELRTLSGQLQQARAGGDILVTILVVVLIIYLVRRI